MADDNNKGSLKKSMAELERMSADEMKQASKQPIILILDDVRSMHNVGSAFRTADAFAIEAIYLCGYTPTPPHRDIHKTALGATETVHWKHFPTTVDAVNAAKQADHTIYSIEQVHGSIPLNEFKWNKTDKLALVFGNEVSGVNEEVVRLSKNCIEIPQFGSKHSLNISVSVGVVLWELIRP